MGATEFEYRHRYLLHAVLYALGFVAPWNFWLHLDPAGPNAHSWGLLAANLAQLGLGSFAVAFQGLLLLAVGCAVAGAFLRTWGSAYLGANVVQSGGMHTAEQSGTQDGAGIVEAGPFCYVRNPLYLGTMLHTVALALAMPQSGAIFILVAIPVLQLRLILAEEPFLQARLGTAYETYCAKVPRLLPALRRKIEAQPLEPRWGQAILGECYMWCVALSFAIAGWWYNASLLMQCVVVSFGVSLLARALGTSTLRGERSA